MRAESTRTIATKVASNSAVKAHVRILRGLPLFAIRPVRAATSDHPPGQMASAGASTYQSPSSAQGSERPGTDDPHRCLGRPLYAFRERPSGASGGGSGGMRGGQSPWPPLANPGLRSTRAAHLLRNPSRGRAQSTSGAGARCCLLHLSCRCPQPGSAICR
jgi:hypothetical protein